MTAFSVIAIFTASGAAGAPTSSADSRAQGLASRVSAPDLNSGAVSMSAPAALQAASECPTARQAVRFYGVRVDYWRTKMGAGAKELGHAQPSESCPRYLAHVLRAKAYGLRRAYRAWWEHHFHWQAWLPANWRALGACETGYGREPGSWTWDSGSYVSAFGIYRAGYADDAHLIGNLSWDETKRKLGRYPTPREQYEAALSHYNTHGDGWGCPGP